MKLPIRLLYLEDDALDRHALARLIREKELAWQVSVATTLAEARCQLANGQYDIIIADYHLPDGECTELFDEVPETPFILLTATLAEHLALRMLEQGADDYLPKDVERHYLNVLPLAVEKALHRQRLYDAEQRLAQKLRESEERLRLLVEGVHDYAIFMLDPEGRVATWNRGAEQIKGYTSQEIIGQPISICYTPEDLAAGLPARAFAEAAERGRNMHEAWLVRKDGSRFWATVSIAPVRSETGELCGFAKVTQDLTDRKRMEDQLRELNRTLEDRVAERTLEAEQKTTQLRRLHARLTSAEQRERKHLARMLHDGLQQILVAAKLRLGMLKPPADEPTQHTDLRWINDLLEQAIESCRSLTAELVPPVLYDRGLVAGLQWLARHMDTNHNCAVSLHADPEAEPDREDLRIMLFEAARELIFNAIKHAGVCQVAVSLTCTEDQCCAQLTVEDEGPGFDPAVIELRRTSEVGYGLFNLRERVHAVGGDLLIDSAVDKRTRVTMTISLARAEPPVHRKTQVKRSDIAPPADENGQAIRVLLADDHKAMRDGIASLLEGESDIQVVGEASDGEQAVEMAHRLRPEVIIMDVTMPKLDGIAATRRVRQELPGIGIVGLSMHNDPNVAQAMCEAGATVYLSKDGPLHEMVEAVRQCAGSKV